jgi:hypothetical protein
MTTTILSLDELQTEIVAAVYKSVPLESWELATMYAKYSPDGQVAGLEFDFQLSDGSTTENHIPTAAHRAMLYGLTKRHWLLIQELSQPTWYKMTVKVSRIGKFDVGFQYNDSYQASDILKRG